MDAKGETAVARRGAAAIALLVLFLSVPAPADDLLDSGEPRMRGIKGDDDRIAAHSEEFPWSAIGRLNRPNNFCTATLVGPALVLTAAHCLWNTRALANFQPASLTFLAGYQQGRFLRQSKVVAMDVSPGFIPGKEGQRANSTQHDWALLTLAEPIGVETGFLGAHRTDRAGLTELKRRETVFVQAGYSQDRKHILTVHVNCTLFGYMSGYGLITHLCDAGPGDSGSPILFFDGLVFRVAALHVGSVGKGEANRGIAVPGETWIARVAAAGTLDGGAPGRAAARPALTASQLMAKLGFAERPDPATAVRRLHERFGLGATGTATPELVGELIRSFRPRPGP